MTKKIGQFFIFLFYGSLSYMGKLGNLKEKKMYFYVTGNVKIRVTLDTNYTHDMCTNYKHTLIICTTAIL